MRPEQQMAATASAKLRDILYSTWSSPVFGDSYPPAASLAGAAIAERIGTVYTAAGSTLREIIAIGMPELDVAAREEIVAQITAKSVGFCGAIAVNDLHDTERLRAASVCIALVYWCDQTMDRGDTAMRAAVRLLTENTQHSTEVGANPLVQARVAALGYLVHEVGQLCRPEDALWVLRAILEDTLRSEARILQLTDEFLHRPNEQFWAERAEEVAYRSIHNGGFIAVVSMIYAIYRQRQPTLPALTEVLHDDVVMAPLRGPGNAAIRIFDDIGDRVIDSGSMPAWGRFTLNLCNQCESQVLNAFVHHAGFVEPRVAAEVVQAIQTGAYDQVITAFVALNRTAFSALPDGLQARHAIFLTLARRVIEAGYVNMHGDDWLAEREVGG
jgi:hypothetical protein